MTQIENTSLSENVVILGGRSREHSTCDGRRVRKDHILFQMHGSLLPIHWTPLAYRATKEKVMRGPGRPWKVQPVVIAIDSDSTSTNQEIENEPPRDTEDAEVKKTRAFYTIQQKK